VELDHLDFDEFGDGNDYDDDALGDIDSTNSGIHVNSCDSSSNK